jgi:glycosyltransferase involved in cell wall biosynthesis
MDKISIIIPVYNAQRVLERCVDSVLKQSYPDFEIILINDGSRDGSDRLCDAYEAKDSRVKVYHQKNGGPSCARNTGLEQASGKWICFIDSDDWIEQDYLLSYITNCEEKDDCLIFQNYHRDVVDQSGELLRSGKRHTYSSKVVNAVDLHFILSKYKLLRNGHPFCKFYNRAIIEDHEIRFDPDIRFSEDLLFLLEYMQYVKSTVFIPVCQYHYICEGSSLSSAYHSFQSEIKCYQLVCNQLQDWISSEEPLDDESRAMLSECRGRFITRALESMFRPATRRSRGERLKALKECYSSVSSRDYSAFNRSPLKALNAVLYRRQYFRLFDLLLTFQFKLRYSLGSIWTSMIRWWWVRKERQA